MVWASMTHTGAKLRAQKREQTWTGACPAADAEDRVLRRKAHDRAFGRQSRRESYLGG